MKGKLTYRRRTTSSALVITMLCVVLLTIIIVAFMQTMSLSLTTSRSYVDMERAQLAAQAGLDTALAQLALATGTNMAFVTGVTNFPSASTPVTVIGEGNLTNLDQMMPLISGPADYLTNFGNSGFANNFNTYTSALVSGDPAQSVDVNTPYQFIQVTSDKNVYRAPWVTMTNIVGTRIGYTRYAYVVLDDAARINPTLMNGQGAGYSNPTNWYTGPQDINLTNASAQVLTPDQMAQVIASSNSFIYSDASLGETFPNRTGYEAMKHLFTSQTNASFDVIPAWYPDGGKPKYNINDLATNIAYGSTPLARALNIASIMTNNLPNFYQRDPALSVYGTNYPTAIADKTLYAQRLAANIVTYISPDSTWGTSEYTTNTTGLSPQVKGIFPIIILQQVNAPMGGAGSGPHTTAQVVTTFWVSCWNPYTTSVTLANAVLHVWRQPSYRLGSGTPTVSPDYTQAYTYIRGNNRVVGPNEFVTLGFPSETITVNGPSTTNGPNTVADTNNGNSNPPFEQYSLTVNGETAAQTQNQPTLGGLRTSNITQISSTNSYHVIEFTTQGSVVGDPRFQNYENVAWYGGTGTNTYSTITWWNGFPVNNSGTPIWKIFPGYDNNWLNRDNIARRPANPGNRPPDEVTTPDKLPSNYNTNIDAPAAPEVIRNGPMVSIGELGHIFDPANADNSLTTNTSASNGDGAGLKSIYNNGGARSLRIGRPEATGAANSSGSPTSFSWDVDGKRAIDLLDIFTVNNANISAAGTTNSIVTNMIYGGAIGRINPNTASANVLSAALSGIQVTSDSGISPSGLANVPSMVMELMTNRPYSSLSDLYKIVPMFDAPANYSPSFALNSSGYLNVVNRVHQEAFGKLIQHLTVQSRTYRIYVIGQVLDNSLNPHSSVAMEVGIYLQYQFNSTDAKYEYEPVIRYVRFLN